MTLTHRQIPALPQRPYSPPIAGKVFRSYPVGHQNFSRACQGKPLTLTLTMGDPIPGNVDASLVTTMASTDENVWTIIPFVQTGERTLTCQVTPGRPGLHAFRSEFSLDGGATWLRDAVPDAWVLVDPPQVDGLRLYTLIPAVSGTIADWKADLKRIKDLGFNAIHLLPLTTQDKSHSPYAARDLFSIEPSYLDPTSDKDGLSQLEGFIQEAISLNIRLCFDLVMNHVGVTSLMTERTPDWIVPDPAQPDGFQRARFWSNQGWENWDDIVLINYEHPSKLIRAEIRSYMTDYALFWAKYANDTRGFIRFDNLHSSAPDFIQALTMAIHMEYPEVAFLAEYFTDDHTLLNTTCEWRLNLLLATPWDYKFVPQLREYLKYIHHVSGQLRFFMPVTSHDSGAPAQEFGTWESTVPRYVAAALLGTGATGMPQGVEFGEKERINFIGRFPKMKYPAKPIFAPLIRRVNSILAEYPAFQRGENCHFVDEDHQAVIAAFRQDHAMSEENEASGFLVACNFDTGSPQSLMVDLKALLGTEGPYTYCDLLSGEAHMVAHAELELHLTPASAHVLMFPAGKDTVQ